MHLSKDQVKRLMQGERVRLTHVNHPTPHTVESVIHLTKRQLTQVQHAFAMGKQPEIVFSKSQARYHGIHGTGFFSDLWDGVKSAASDVWNSVVKPNLGSVASMAQSQLKRYGGGIHHPALVSAVHGGRIRGGAIRCRRRRRGAGIYAPGY